MSDTPRHADLSSAESEDRFRQIFLTHLEAEGVAPADAHRLIFRTPAPFHGPPSQGQGLELLDAFRQSYHRQLPHGWFFEGVDPRLPPDQSCLEAPERPVTFVVIPGIFGEFIEQLPFESVVSDEDSNFRVAWQTALEEAEDDVFSLLELKEEVHSLSELVKIGSLDRGARSYANVIVLRASGGSLETLGSLESNAEVYQRRLNAVFDVIDDDTDIYLVGYSRGLAVALELVSRLYRQDETDEMPPETRHWHGRVRGVVGLGGVFYGAGFARDVMSGESGAASELLQLLEATAEDLEIVPEGARLKEKGEIVAHNARAWGHFVKQLSAAKAPKVAAGQSFLGSKLEEVVSREGKARILGRDVPPPNSWGMLSLVNNFFLKTFNLKKSVSHYNENILALKKLVEAVVVGVDTLTPESRDEWWRTHPLPDDLVLFSITGSMPDAYLNDFESPLWHFDGYGARTSDYNVSLRASFYTTLASENTMINDSQVSHYCSRYWEQMYPEHEYKHYYLGVLGTHHWGMAFPYTIKDDAKIGANAFPRGTLLKSVASFISSLGAGRRSAG